MGDAQTRCSEVLTRLYEYLDNEIGAEDCAEIERHLEKCEPCLRRAGFEREIKLLIARKCSGGTVPTGMLERVLARLRGAAADPTGLG